MRQSENFGKFGKINEGTEMAEFLRLAYAQNWPSYTPLQTRILNVAYHTEGKLHIALPGTDPDVTEHDVCHHQVSVI